MVLVQLSVVRQRLDAVRAVLAGATATEVAASIGAQISWRENVADQLSDHSGVGSMADSMSCLG